MAIDSGAFGGQTATRTLPRGGGIDMWSQLMHLELAHLELGAAHGRTQVRAAGRQLRALRRRSRREWRSWIEVPAVSAS